MRIPPAPAFQVHRFLKIKKPHNSTEGKQAYEKMFHLICHQGIANTDLSEWSKSRTLTTSNAGEHAEQQERSFIADRNEWKKGTATSKDSLSVSYKTKHTLTIQSRNQAPWYLLKEE